MVNSYGLPGFEMLSWTDQDKRKKFDSLVDTYSYSLKYAYCGKYSLPMDMINFKNYHSDLNFYLADCADADVRDLSEKYKKCAGQVTAKESELRHLKNESKGDVNVCMNMVKEKMFHLGKENGIATLTIFFKCIGSKATSKETFNKC